MWDRYDVRDSQCDRDDGWDRNFGSQGGANERDCDPGRDPRDVFTKDLDLPHGRERRPVRERDRICEINGTESRMLATVGAFRVVCESDLHDGREGTWLGPARDKRRHFVRHLESRLDVREYPHLTFGDGPEKTVRYFPDKLPIGVLPELDHHAFVYLATSPSPMDFRLFLLRHVPLLRVLFRWTIRVLFPRPLWKARVVYQRASTWATVWNPRMFRFSSGFSLSASASPNPVPGQLRSVT